MFRIYYFFCFILVSGWWRLNFFHNGNLFWLSVYSCVQLIVNGMFPYKQSCLYANILLVTVAWNVFFTFLGSSIGCPSGLQDVKVPPSLVFILFLGHHFSHCYEILYLPLTPMMRIRNHFFHWHQQWGTFLPTDIKDRALFLQLTPTMRHCSSNWHQWWGIISQTDSNDGALFFPLTPKMGHWSYHWHQWWGIIPLTDTNNGASFLQLIPMMVHYFSTYWPQVLWNFCYSHWPPSLRHCFLPLTLGHLLLPMAIVYSS